MGGLFGGLGGGGGQRVCWPPSQIIGGGEGGAGPHPHPLFLRLCVYSNSCNEIPRVAQQYGTIAAHTRHHVSVLVMLVVFCVHMHSFAGLNRRRPQPTFSDTAITNRHSDTTIFQLRAHWMRISWSIGSEKWFGHVPLEGDKPSSSCVQGEHSIH